jgi:hypothetical protein
MPLLVRRANKGALWAKYEEEKHWEAGNFPYELLSDFADSAGTGLSFWKIASSRDIALHRIAAALTCVPTADQLRSADFRVVRESSVIALGVAVVQTNGGTKDQGINHLHYELRDVTGPRIVKLAKKLCSRSIPFSAEMVARYIANSVIKGHMQPADVPQKLLADLRKHGALSFKVPK